MRQRNLKKKVLRLIKKKKFDEALLFVEQKHSHAKNSSFFYSIYSMINIFMGRYYEAKLFIEKALRMNPNDLFALEVLGYTLLLEEQFKDAAQVYLKAIRVNPKNRKVKKIINNFKKDSKIKRYASKLTPGKYFLGISYYVSTYQKVTTVLAVIVIVGILGYSKFFKSLLNLSSKISIIKVRDKYEEKLFLTSEEIIKKKKLAKNLSLSTNDRLIHLNELLMTFNTLEDKIRMDHLLRRVIVKENSIIIFKTLSIKEITSNPSRYDGIRITIKGELNKELQNYKIITKKGFTLKLKDKNGIIDPYQGKVVIYGVISILNKKLLIIPLDIKYI